MKQLQTNKGFIMVPKELFKEYYIPWDSAFLLSYIIDVYPILKTKIVYEGTEYRQLATWFINEALPGFGVDKTINSRLEPLEELGFIKVEHFTPRGKKSDTGARFIHLNVELIDGITDSTTDITTDITADRTIDRTADRTIDRTIDRTTDRKNFQQKIHKDIKDTKDTINTSKEATAEAATLKSKAYKNLINYINQLNFNDNSIKEELLSWYETHGKGKVSVEQLQSKLKDIANQTNNNEALIKEAIKYSNYKGYMAFYPKQNNFKSNAEIHFNRNYTAPTEIRLADECF